MIVLLCIIKSKLQCYYHLIFFRKKKKLLSNLIKNDDHKLNLTILPACYYIGYIVLWYKYIIVQHFYLQQINHFNINHIILLWLGNLVMYTIVNDVYTVAVKVTPECR